MFDARAGAWADGTVVLVEDGLIAGVTRSAPDGWPVLERPGTSLLPGLIDAHTHVLLRTSSNELELARQMVEENPGHRAASAVQAMAIVAPARVHHDPRSRHGGRRLLRRRPARRRAGGHRARPADARRRARHPVDRPLSGAWPAAQHDVPGRHRQLHRRRSPAARPCGPRSPTGSTCLKIYVSERFERARRTRTAIPDGPLVWTEEEVHALVDEAHRQGLKVAAHSLTLSGAKMAVAAGVDSIEHGFAISPDLAADMAARGTALVPTLLVSREHAAHGSVISDAGRVAAHDRSFANCLEAGRPDRARHRRRRVRVDQGAIRPRSSP